MTGAGARDRPDTARAQHHGAHRQALQCDLGLALDRQRHQPAPRVRAGTGYIQKAPFGIRSRPGTGHRQGGIQGHASVLGLCRANRRRPGTVEAGIEPGQFIRPVLDTQEVRNDQFAAGAAQTSRMADQRCQAGHLW